MSAQIGQAASELVKSQVQQDPAKQAPKAEGSRFDAVLANKGVEGNYTGPGTFPANGANATNGTKNVQSTAEAAQARVQQYMQAEHVNMNQMSSPIAGKQEPSKIAQTLSGVLSDMETGQGRLDTLINQHLSGKQMSNTDMLSLQASMYKYTLEMDLTGKVVEKATSGLKDTLKTQV